MERSDRWPSYRLSGVSANQMPQPIRWLSDEPGMPIILIVSITCWMGHGGKHYYVRIRREQDCAWDGEKWCRLCDLRQEAEEIAVRDKFVSVKACQDHIRRSVKKYVGKRQAVIIFDDTNCDAKRWFYKDGD